MPKNKMPKSRNVPFFKKNKFLKIILIVFLISVIIFALALLIETDSIKNPFTEINYKAKLFVIEDVCSPIAGELLHTIEDEEICEHKCKSECNLRNLNFYDSKFVKIENDCNECNCYCK